MADSKIIARIEELQSIHRERHNISVDDIVIQLDADRELARANGQASAAVSATMGKAKVLGLIVDRHLVGVKKIEDMSEDELRALLGTSTEA